ncbi:hypothetical protein [Chryseobacterium sp. Alg-005]|uniref:hypothetical protein n=1 Tax=Chryseobacterium sp. Alg-005 TaxID=3159516 RepID=UPI0036F20212
MINVSKIEVLKLLAQIDDVIFVGGASEYLQGIKAELNDIDISVSSKEVLNEIGYVHTNSDNSFYGLSGKRGFIPLKSVLIDVFIDEKKPQFRLVDSFKCETVDSMIALQENTLKLGLKTLSDKTRIKLTNNINRLKSWQV